MMPPINCPFKGLTAPPCWTCPNHIADTDQCSLACVTVIETNNTGTGGNVYFAQTYEQRLRDYERRRQELLRLSKETLVDLILHRPTY